MTLRPGRVVGAAALVTAAQERATLEEPLCGGTCLQVLLESLLTFLFWSIFNIIL